MPVRPIPLEIRCPQCGWREVWQPASDALTDQPAECCPRCNYAELRARPASAASVLWRRLRQWLIPS